MGHVRLGVLPKSRNWRQAIDLLYSQLPTDIGGSPGRAEPDALVFSTCTGVTQPRDPRTGERLRYYQGLGLLS